jgi:lysophospholipase L1-like esterase
MGDSVMLGATEALQGSIGGIEIDAAVGRQASAMTEILASRYSAGLIKGLVVVQMGNNGPVSEKQFDDLMANLKDARQVLIVNLKLPRQWEAHNNSLLAEGVKRYPNATLIDWYSVGSSHPEYFWDDGIHLRPEGAQSYAKLIAAAIK